MVLTIFLFFAVVVNAQCPQVQPMSGVNLTEWIRATWYVQEQQLTSYQKKEDLFCVVATYAQEDKTVPFFSGNVLAVHNYANKDHINGAIPSDVTLCARQPDKKKTGKLLVAPCFLPNALSGDYWVLAAGPSPDNYTWAVVTGGQPTVQFPDGCTTKEDSINNSGLWIFHRQPVAPAADLVMAKNELKLAGYTLSRLQPVPQEGCYYKGAVIKD